MNSQLASLYFGEIGKIHGLSLFVVSENKTSLPMHIIHTLNPKTLLGMLFYGIFVHEINFLFNLILASEVNPIDRNFTQIKLFILLNKS